MRLARAVRQGIPGDGTSGAGTGPSARCPPISPAEVDAVIVGLSQVELGLQAALGLPADPARKRAGEALDDLTGVIEKIRATVSAACDQPAPPRAPRR